MDEFLTLFQKTENYFTTFMGKPGHNPFFKLEELIQIRKMYEKGDKDKALEKLKAIKLEPPVTNEKPTTVIHAKAKSVETLPAPGVVEQAQEQQKTTGVDIQTPKPVEPPKKSMSAKK